MQFPDSYFEDEVRDGFYVSGIMKRAWAAQLEVLEEIGRVCEKYNIRWFMDCGTLLGAVRHGGYIPWDDDLDICMLRDDYNRFNQVAARELPEKYVLLNVHTNDEYCELLTRVTNGRHICVDKEHLEKYHGFPYVAGIDIFPLDYLASDPEEEEFRKQLASIVNGVATGINNENQNYEHVRKAVAQVEELCGVKFDYSRSLKPQLYILLDQLFSLYPSNEATDVVLMPYWIDKGNHKYPLEYFEKTVMLPYEVMELPAPAMYESVLKIEYGDYMQNRKKGGVHDYPFFDDMEKQLMGWMDGKSPYKYELTESELQYLKEDRTTKKDAGTRKEVVFFPCKASHWDAMESVWRAAVDDPDCDVYVVPVPYYYKQAGGTYSEMYYEKDLYPSYVPVTHYNDYDFSVRKPDIMFIQNPYDSYHYTMTVDPVFYATNLKLYTDKLVYIPYFMLDEFTKEDERSVQTMEYFVKTPGVVHSDVVIVQSEQMRQNYIEALVKFAGEDTRNIWEQKILGTGSPKMDKSLTEVKDTVIMPEQWRSLMKKEDGSYKKVILYNTSVSTLMEHKERMLEKIQEVFEIFKENQKDIMLLWRPHPLIRTTIEITYPELWNSYRNLVEQYRQEGWGIYDDTSDLERAIAICDAYYGDKSSVAQTCQKAGKPVMIQDVEI